LGSDQIRSFFRTPDFMNCQLSFQREQDNLFDFRFSEKFDN